MILLWNSTHDALSGFAAIVAIAFLVAAVIGAEWYFRRMFARHRTRQMHSLAEKLGFHFLPDNQLPADLSLKRTHLRSWRGGIASNVFQGHFRGLRVVIFDWRIMGWKYWIRTTVIAIHPAENKIQASASMPRLWAEQAGDRYVYYRWGWSIGKMSIRRIETELATIQLK